MSRPQFHTETPQLPLPGGQLTLLGASRQVTGAATVVEQDGVRVLVDAGFVQGRDREPIRWDRLGAIDAVVLTHGHLDHIGGLPTLFARGLRAPIYATAATLAIARLSLEDSMDLQGEDEHAVRQVQQLLRERAVALPYDRPVRLGTTQLALREAGHILGSASADLQAPSSRVVVSGDLGRFDSPILRDPCTEWGDARAVDLALVESTYGARDHRSDTAAVQRQLERVVRRAVETSGKIFVPAFAIGRTQVLLYLLDELFESGRAPEIPVALDTPMGVSVTKTYKRFTQLYDKEALEQLARGDDPLDFNQLYAVEEGRDSRRLRELDGPMLILAGAGMVTGGRIVQHLLAGLHEPDNTVVFTGYQAPGTPGAAIVRAAEQGADHVMLRGQRVRLGARVEVLQGLSAHADRRELTRWLRALPGLKAALTHHGDPAAQRGLLEHAQSTWNAT